MLVWALVWALVWMLVVWAGAGVGGSAGGAETGSGASGVSSELSGSGEATCRTNHLFLYHVTTAAVEKGPLTEMPTG